MNLSPRIDVSTLNTVTTVVPGVTANVLVVAAEDFEEIRFIIPIASITGSPIFTISSSPDNVTYTAETDGVYTRSSADNNRILVFSVFRPTKAWYRIALNLNGGTVNYGSSNNGCIAERFNPRRIPFVSGSTNTFISKTAN